MNLGDESYFRQICDHLGFVCVAVDPDLRVRFWNQQAARQFGVSAEAVEGRPFLEVLKGPDREAAQALFEDTIAERSSHEMELRYTGDDDQRLIFVLIVSPILDAAGACIGASASMRNITERKRLSRELSRARRMGSLGKMAGAVAHHFNNILGGMMTSIDCVLASDSPRELRRTLRLLAHSIGRATRITQQLASFAESENAQDIENDLDSLLAQFKEWLETATARTNITLDASIASTPSGPFDSNRLLSVLKSIAQNALDAMPEGGTVGVNVSHDGEYATIRISDTGAGIAEDVLEQVFEPFFTTKSELGGSDSEKIGLGLSAVHGLVAEMGGTISIASKLGEGTQVTVRLPLDRAKQMHACEASPEPAGARR